MRGSFCSIINKLLENYTLQNFKGGRGGWGGRGIDRQLKDHLRYPKVSLTVPSLFTGDRERNPWLAKMLKD